MFRRVIASSTRLSNRMATRFTSSNTASSGSEGLLPDGRVSLKQAYSVHNEHKFFDHWLKDPSTYPIIFVMVGALSILGFACTRTLLREPDLCYTKERRTAVIPGKAEEGEAWNQGGRFKSSLMGRDASHNSIFSPLKSFGNKVI